MHPCLGHAPNKLAQGSRIRSAVSATVVVPVAGWGQGRVVATVSDEVIVTGTGDQQVVTGSPCRSALDRRVVAEKNVVAGTGDQYVVTAVAGDLAKGEDAAVPREEIVPVAAKNEVVAPIVERAVRAEATPLAPSLPGPSSTTSSPP